MAGYDNELSRIVEELNRAAPGTRTAERRTPHLVPVSASLDQLLSYATKNNASDVLLVTGSAVAMRVNGALTPATGPILSPDDISHLLLPLLDPAQFEELQRSRSVDFCFVREAIGRFRANLHYQRGTLAASVRLLPARIPTLE